MLSKAITIAVFLVALLAYFAVPSSPSMTASASGSYDSTGIPESLQLPFVLTDEELEGVTGANCNGRGPCLPSLPCPTASCVIPGAPCFGCTSFGLQFSCAGLWGDCHPAAVHGGCGLSIVVGICSGPFNGCVSLTGGAPCPRLTC